jgi:hypothetical protein
MLKRCADDKARLKERVRAAKKQKDKDTVARCNLTLGQIGMKTMMAEGKPLLWSIIPIALVASWAFSRIGYLPPQANQSVSVKMFFPEFSEELVHLVPQDGVTSDNGFIRYALEDKTADGSSTGAGVAEWNLRVQERANPYILQFRFSGKTIEKEFVADGLRYATPVSSYGDNPMQLIQLDLPVYKPLNIIPGFTGLMLDPWVIGYLIMVIPLSFALKSLFRIY